MGVLFESHTWIVVLAAWSVLLLLGLAGGDPLAAGRPGCEALLIRLVKWACQAWSSRGRAAPGVHHAPAPARRAKESGLYPVA